MKYAYSYHIAYSYTTPTIKIVMENDRIIQVIVVDPTSAASGPPLKLGETLLKHATPVRVGLVLAPPAAGADPLAARLSAAVRSAFNYVAQETNSNKEAYYFLSQVCIVFLILFSKLTVRYRILNDSNDFKAIWA